MKYTLRDAASTLRLESPKERQCRGMIAQDGGGRPAPSSVPKGKLNKSAAFCEFGKKIFISHKVCSDLPPCNRYLVPTFHFEQHGQDT